jgi:hypothetical protein
MSTIACIPSNHKENGKMCYGILACTCTCTAKRALSEVGGPTCQPAGAPCCREIVECSKMTSASYARAYIAVISNATNDSPPASHHAIHCAIHNASATNISRVMPTNVHASLIHNTCIPDVCMCTAILCPYRALQEWQASMQPLYRDPSVMSARL